MNVAYDLEKIEEVLQDFYCITHIKTVLYSGDFSSLVAVPFHECTFCAAMSRVPEAGRKCYECTQNALKLCREKKELIVYRCHAGLIEAVVPIQSDDIILGYMMLGQVLEENCDRDALIRYAATHLGKIAKQYLEETEIKSAESIRAAARLMESCVCYLLMNAFIHEKHGNIVLDLKQYIEKNPAADLSVTALCEKFAVSRNYLYKISNTYFGMSIAHYVRTKRLRCAEGLIREGVSVTAAAEQAGFYDYGYFGKIYKRYLGNTPTKTPK